MTKLFDLVVNVVGSSSPAAGGKGGQRPAKGAAGKGGDSKIQPIQATGTGQVSNRMNSV